MAALAGACRERSASSPSGGAPQLAPLGPGEARLHPPASSKTFRVAEVEHAAESIAFTLTVETPPTPGEEIEPLIFCVPDGKELRLDGPRGATIAPIGVQRRWRLAAVRFKQEFFTAVGSTPARLAIEWEGAVEPPASAPHPGELAPDSMWSRVGRALVANPEGRALYQIGEPGLAQGVNVEPDYPPAKFASRQPWLRLRIREEGLHRLDLALAAGVGPAPAAGDPSGVRVFHRGEPYPLIRRGEGREQIVYLWNAPNDSPYSAERVYWVTWAPNPIDPLVAHQNPNLANVPAERIDRIPRTARAGDERQLRVTYGDFMAIEGMEWVDRPIRIARGEEAATAIELSIRFDRPIAAAGSPAARLQTYYEVPPGARRSASESIQVSIERDGRSIGQVALRPRSGATSMSIDPSAIEEGVMNFALVARAEAAAPPLAGALWLQSFEVDYPSEPRLAGGRLTLRERGSGNPIKWTPLPDLAEMDPTARGGLVMVSVVEGVDPRTERGLSEIAPTELDGDAGVVWIGGHGRRVEVYQESAVPVADAFERPGADDPTDARGGVDDLIVAHADFVAGVAPLVESARAAGRRARVVEVQSIYDRFGGGELSPEALRDYFAFTLARWGEGAPDRILLVGDCTSDYRGFTRNDVKNWVPSYTYSAGREERWASDDWMATVAGDDALADFAIGRISVNDARDLKTIVEKRLAHEVSAPFDRARARIALIGDADGETPFAEDLDVLAESLAPDSFQARKLYLRDLPFEDNWYIEEAALRGGIAAGAPGMKISSEATRGIYNAFTDGVAMMTYFGHGSPNIWADQRIWHGGDTPASDNLLLAGSGRAAFVVNLTCNSGAIDYPIPRWNVNMIEDMLRTENGGAIATFVPSGPGLASLHRAVGKEVFGAIFGDGLRGLGEIVLTAKSRYLAADNAPQFAYMYVLLGDPSMRLQMTETVTEFALAKESYAPGDRIERTLVDLVPASGRYVLETLDADGRMLSSSPPQSFDGGRIRIELPVEADWPAGDKTLRLYAWSEAERRDVAASARWRIAEAALEWGDAALERDASGGWVARLTVRNPSEIAPAEGRIEIAPIVAGAPGEVVQSLELRLEPGATVERAVEVSGSDRFDLRLIRARPPRDWTAPGVIRRRLAASPVDGADEAPQGARLRLRPESIGFSPEEPTEGETVFVTVEVENAGDRASGPAVIALYTGDPDAGGTPADNRAGVARDRLPPLGAGRVRSVRLRWDPVNNAGESELWIGMEALGGGEAPPRADRIAATTIRALTKARLRAVNFRVLSNPEDIRRRRRHFHVDVFNDGESTARNVSVRFYRGRPSPETLLHEEILAEVPPTSADRPIAVHYAWSFARNEDLYDADGRQLVFEALVGLQGSRELSNPRAGEAPPP
jgi:hypothetical protein